MRDLQKDLEICDRATSGPWLMAEEPEVILENTFSQPVILSAVCFYDDLGASKVEAIQANDLEFIIQAREGWPHAIERAIKAEAFVMELASSLKESIEYCEVCRDEYAYSNNPPRSRLCARCQTFYLHMERVEEVLGDEQT